MTDAPIKTATHASESGHWWNKHGELIETYQGKPVTLREARKLDLGPGTTAVSGIMDRYHLNIWKQKQAAKAARDIPKQQPDETEDDWLKRVLVKANEVPKQAAEKGTAVHAAVQQYYTNGDVFAGFEKEVEAISGLINQIVGPSIFQPEVPCVSTLGYATKADLIQWHVVPGEVDDDGYYGRWLFDLKGKNFTQADIDNGTDVLKLYETHHMQLAGTRLAARHKYGNATIGERCVILFFSRTVPGLVHAAESPAEKLQWGEEMFRACNRLWQIKNNWRPSWATE